MDMKTCVRCDREYPATKKCFPLNKDCEDGLSSYCKRCHYITNPVWRKNIKKKSNKKYNKMFKRQNGLCAICGLPEITKRENTTKKLAIDHSHNTNKVRGLLCYKCNLALGLLKVDNFGILNLEKTIEYLNSSK